MAQKKHPRKFTGASIILPVLYTSFRQYFRLCLLPPPCGDFFFGFQPAFHHPFNLPQGPVVHRVDDIDDIIVNYRAGVHNFNPFPAFKPCRRPVFYTHSISPSAKNHNIQYRESDIRFWAHNPETRKVSPRNGKYVPK